MFRTFVRQSEKKIIALSLFIISVIIAADIWLDISSGLPITHVIHEIMILIFCLGLTIFQWRGFAAQSHKIKKIEAALAAEIASREAFQRKSMRFSAEFASAVKEQFSLWNLSDSEQDIAILLIKGMSMKEIAMARESRESTVRQQAAAIYRKAGLENRQQLASFFLEDLFIDIEN